MQKYHGIFRHILLVVILSIMITLIYLYGVISTKDMGISSDKYRNDYIAWENTMLDINPNYENLKILIDVEEKRLYLLNNNDLINSYTIASGKLSTPSPLGLWKIVNKARWSGGFGTRWMGLNVPWGSYGIHGTNKPGSIGYNASAGCIRMNNRDVEDLYKYVKVNTPVVIVNGLYGPFGYGMRIIKPGHWGSDVIEIQRRLRALGYYNSEHLDGKYGPMLEQALYDFQRDNNLPKDPNIGPDVYDKLGVILME